MKKTCPSFLEVQYFGEKRRGGHYRSKHKNGKLANCAEGQANVLWNSRGRRVHFLEN